MIVELTAEQFNELKASNPKRIKSARPQSEVTYNLSALLETFHKYIRETEKEKENDKTLKNLFDGYGRLYFSDFTEEKLKIVLSWQANATVAAVFEKLIPSITKILELSERQDETAIYNARKR